MGDTENVTLNLDGNFATEADRAAAATRALDSSLADLKTRADAYADPKMRLADQYRAQKSEADALVAVQAKIAAFDPARTRELAKQEALLKRMRDEALGETEGAKGGGISGLDIAVAGAFERAGERLLQAGAELVKGAVELTIAESSKHEVQGAILDQLGGDYEASVHLGLQLGINPDEAVNETKRLLNAKFKATEIPELIRVRTGMEQIRAGSGDELLEKLQKITLEPKVKSKDVDALAKLGIDTKEVYARLANELGVSVPMAMAKVKAGAIDSDRVLNTIVSVAGDRFGGLADKIADSTPALLARVKGDFVQLFDLGPEALGPLKDVLHNLIGVLEGPEGAELKGAAKEVVEELNHAFLDEFRGEEGRARLKEFAHDLASSIHELAGTVHELAPLMQLLEKLATIWPKVDVAVRALTNPLAGARGLAERLGEMAGGDEGARGPEKPVTEETFDPDKALADAYPVGTDIDDGIVQGINDGSGEVAAAAAAMADSAIAGARERLRSHSPSEAFGDIGGDSAQGYADRLATHPGPARAASSMAASALAAASGVPGPGAAAGGAANDGGSVALTFSPQVQLLAGSAAEAEEGVSRALTAQYPQFLAMARRAVREARVGYAGG